MDFKNLLGNENIILDTPLNIYLQSKNLLPSSPSSWNHPELQETLQAAYRSQIDAGADCLTALTRDLLESHISEPLTPAEISQFNIQALRVARAVAGEKAINAIIRARGIKIEPWGEVSFDSALATYQDYMAILVANGANLLTIIGFTDLQELRVMLIAANSVSTALPKLVFWDGAKLMQEPAIESVLTLCESLDVAAIGGEADYSASLQLLNTIKHLTNLPIIVRLSAESSGLVAEHAVDLINHGAAGIGLTATTELDAIKIVSKTVKGKKPNLGRREYPLRIASAYQTVKIGSRLPFVKIGERINPTGRRALARELVEEKLDTVLADAHAQVAAGADALDVNVGAPMVAEAKLMARAIAILQKEVRVPLVLDSASTEVITAGLQLFAGKALVNSVNAKDKRLLDLLPVVKKYGAAVIGLTIGEKMPESAEERLKLAEKIVAACRDYQIDPGNILIDPAALAIATAEQSGPAVLKAIYLIKEKLGLPISVGASNTSFGLPTRHLVHNTFLVQAMAMGLDAAILNPLDSQVHDLIAAASLFTGRDPYCRNYLKSYRLKMQKAEKST